MHSIPYRATITAMLTMAVAGTAAAFPSGARGATITGTVYVQRLRSFTKSKVSLAKVTFTQGSASQSGSSGAHGSYSAGPVTFGTWAVTASHHRYTGYTVYPSTVFTNGRGTQKQDVYLCEPGRLTCGPLATQSPTAAPTPFPCTTSNQVANPGAEHGPVGWQKFVWEPQDDGTLYTGSRVFDGITDESAASGTYSFELSESWYPGSSYDPEVDGTVIHYVYQDVIIPFDATAVTVQGYLWNSIANSGISGYAVLQVYYYDSSGNQYGFMNLRTSETDTETWHVVEQTASLPSVAVRLRVVLDRGSVGGTDYNGNVARYDDISVMFECP